ncbi:MAG: hypothetical protein AAB214_17985, partial [Fibrobacterota bacterium]
MTSRLAQPGTWTQVGTWIQAGRWTEFCIICLAGVALALCVPPLPMGPMVPVVLAGILGWLAPKSPGKAALAAFLAGFVFHLATLHWIKNVMSVGPPVT